MTLNAHQALQLSDRWEIKKYLEIPFVMEEFGHTPEFHNHDGRLDYVNPFRDDTNPSLNVFVQTIKGRPEPEQRYGDFAEGTNGDVFDLLARFRPDLSPPQINDLARELLAKQIETKWDGPTVERSERHGLDMTSVEILLDLALPLTMSAETWWDTVRTRPGLTDIALPQDRVFLDPQHDRVVFVLRDETGTVRGVRFRNSNGTKNTESGSENILMRLGPPEPQKPVFLCEGETDTWAAWAALHDEYEVLGVPGVGNHPERVAGHVLDGRRVFIAFDPDTAGQTGAAAWRAFLSERGAAVAICVLPAGRDVASLTGEAIHNLPDRARVLPPRPERFDRHGAAFGLVNKNGDMEPLSNWSFEPRSVLVGEDGTRSYEGVLLPSQRRVVLPASALASRANLLKWGQKYQARWFGNDNHVQLLAALIDYDAAFLPEGRITDQVGLYEGSFVWPDGHLGATEVYYQEPATAIGIGPNEISLPDEPVDPIAVFMALYQLQHPAVTTPMLSWLAVAPLRTRFREFPILSIQGASGSGKTALTEEMLRVFSGTNITTNLTSTTPHAVGAFIAASNGFPVWFDEYRPGARTDAKHALDQMLRDAYTGQSSSKGGQNRSNLNEVTNIRTNSPIVVTGEDDFTETSHTDRMVLVRLVQREQGDIRRLRSIDTAGFARAYLKFLLRADHLGQAPVHETYRPAPADGLRPRQGANAAVLQQGWWLLEAFLTDYDPTFNMPPLDLGRIIAAGEAAGATDPVMEAIQYCLENTNSTPGPTAVWLDDEYLYVSSANLLSQAKNIPGIILPASSAKGISGVLTDKYGAETVRAFSPSPGLNATTRVRACRLRRDAVEWLNGPDQENHENHSSF